MDPKSLPAFPFPDPQGPAPGAELGMTLRDYFAAKAVVGLMGRSWGDFKGTDEALIETWATSAYAVADAMLNARSA